jgi:pimeloyl-ACP methyl ester carboxylesterase
MNISLIAAGRFHPLNKQPSAPLAPNLPPVPALEEEQLKYEQFAAPGLEAVDVIRPAQPQYGVNDPRAPALVLVPGLGMDCRGYIKQFPLGSIAELHLPQATNQSIEGEEGLGHFARHVEEYILQKKLHERPGGFILGGSSMGGAVSLHVCTRGKVQPRALVLIGSFANARHLPAYQRALAPLSWYLPVDRFKRMLKPLLSWVRHFGGITGGDALWIVSGRSRHTRHYYGRAIMALTRQNQIESARNLKLPTLILHGTRDWVLPHAAGKEMADAIPNARFVSIKGGGHGFFYTHADEVNAEIAAFVEEVRENTAGLRGLTESKIG